VQDQGSKRKKHKEHKEHKRHRQEHDAHPHDTAVKSETSPPLEGRVKRNASPQLTQSQLLELRQEARRAKARSLSREMREELDLEIIVD
jgi:hypothetical protein